MDRRLLKRVSIAGLLATQVAVQTIFGLWGTPLAYLVFAVLFFARALLFGESLVPHRRD